MAVPALIPHTALLAALLSLAGIAVLYAAWRRPGRSVLLCAAGWGLLAVSAVPWAAAGGSDRGVALGLTVIMAGALLLIGVTGQWRGGKSRRERRTATAAAEPVSGAGWRHWVRLSLVAGPLAAATAFALSLPIMHITAWTEANRLMAAASAIVILWSAGAVWACATPHLPRVSTTLAGLAVAGSALLLVL